MAKSKASQSLSVSVEHDDDITTAVLSEVWWISCIDSFRLSAPRKSLQNLDSAAIVRCDSCGTFVSEKALARP